MRNTALAKKTKSKGTRDYYKMTYAEKCYLGSKSVNLVITSEKALVLAEGILGAVNAGKRRIDIRVLDPKHGVLVSGNRAGITVTSPKRSTKI
jgi:hypothetical protein